VSAKQWKRLLNSAVVAGLALTAERVLAQPTFSIGDAAGPPGAEVQVPLSLLNDDGEAVSAGVDIAFDDADLIFTPPVASSCVIDDRLASTHQLGGSVRSPGVVNVEIFIQFAPPPLPALENGRLAVCTFSIRGDAQPGSMFPVGATNVLIGDDMGAEIPSQTDDGLVTVSEPVGCLGDCSGDGAVTIEEVVTGVDVLLGPEPLAVCTALDRNSDGAATIEEIAASVANALNGCAP
jgi:hypothetical protein